ncbi:Spy/CpxP family protein refolding chaperone [Elusimicrobiota bacterium]
MNTKSSALISLTCLAAMIIPHNNALSKEQAKKKQPVAAAKTPGAPAGARLPTSYEIFDYLKIELQLNEQQTPKIEEIINTQNEKFEARRQEIAAIDEEAKPLRKKLDAILEKMKPYQEQIREIQYQIRRNLWQAQDDIRTLLDVNQKAKFDQLVEMQIKQMTGNRTPGRGGMQMQRGSNQFAPPRTPAPKIAPDSGQKGKSK